MELQHHELRDLGVGIAGGLLALRASQAPDNLALVFEGQEWTYRQLDDEAKRVGAGLLALGLTKGDAVGMFMTNRPEYLFASGGLTRAGVTAVAVNTGYKGNFLHFTLDHSSARVLITESLLAEAVLTMDPLPAALETIVYLDGVPPRVPGGKVRVMSWDDLLAAGDPDAVFAPVQAHDVTAITFTSGTTGRSKGVVSPYLHGIMMAKEASVAFNITPRDRLYTCMPLFHGMGLVTTYLAAVYAGATTILSRRFSVTGYWKELRETGATQANALGSMLYMLMTAPPTPQDREHQVTRIFSAPAPADVLYRFEARFGTHIIEGYGQAETKNILYNPMHARKIGSMGLPTPTSIIEIQNEDGQTLPPGAVGEIVYRPRVANIMLRNYHREPEKTLESIRNLWWRTGDLGSMDEDGYFYFFDRKTDALRRRGENISSHEVESVVSNFAGIREAAVVAAHSEVGEDEVLLVFEAPEDVAIEMEVLFKHCAAYLPHFMVPRYYRRLAVLPRTPTGKVQKVELRGDGITADTWDAQAAGHVPTRNY
ncbi:AMP-binding protein [Deinococcus sp. UYEF24]